MKEAEYMCIDAMEHVCIHVYGLVVFDIVLSTYARKVSLWLGYMHCFCELAVYVGVLTYSRSLRILGV